MQKFAKYRCHFWNQRVLTSETFPLKKKMLKRQVPKPAH